MSAEKGGREKERGKKTISHQHNYCLNENIEIKEEEGRGGERLGALKKLSAEKKKKKE